MTRLTMIACDACGRPAPSSHSSVFAGPGWFHIRGDRYAGDADACSSECLVDVAQRFNATDDGGY